MKRLLISAAVLLALAGAAQATARDVSSAATREPVVAMLGRGLSWHLVRVDPVSLRTRPGRTLDIDLRWDDALPSQDRSWLAMARYGPELRLLRLGTMQQGGAIWFRGATVHPLAWLSAHRLVATVEDFANRTFSRTLVGIDPAARTVVWRRPLGRTVVLDAARVRDRLVLLVGPETPAGPARLLSLGPDGSLRSIELGRVLAGASADANAVWSMHRPGLAVDPKANRAYVVGADAPLAQIELSRMTVAYRGGDRTLAKVGAGPERRAVWLGNGMLAVTGSDTVTSAVGGGLVRSTTTPIGLYLVEVETGAARLVERNASTARLVGRSLVVFGTASDSTARQPTGFGLTVLGLDGGAPLHLFGNTPITEVRAQGGLAYVSVPDRSGHVVVLDPDARRILANVTRLALRLLTG